MSSSFKGQDIFGSGPHRFSVGPQGQSVVPNAQIGGTPPGSTAQGLRELDITVRGRLVAPSESALWDLRDAVTALLTDPPTTATLTDLHAHDWAGMSFITYRELAPADRSRVFSIPYEATFRRFV